MAIKLWGTQYQHNHTEAICAAAGFFAKLHQHKWMGTWKGIDKDSFFALWFAAVRPDLPSGEYQVYAEYRTTPEVNYNGTYTYSITKLVGIKLIAWDDVMPGHSNLEKLGDMTV